MAKHDAIMRYIVEPIEITGVVKDAFDEFDVYGIADEILVNNNGYDLAPAFIGDNDPNSLDFWEIVQEYAFDKEI